MSLELTSVMRQNITEYSWFVATRAVIDWVTERVNRKATP